MFTSRNWRRALTTAAFMAILLVSHSALEPGVRADHDGTSSTVHCGDTVTASVVLTADLDCTSHTGNALTVTADGITIDGQGHSILAPVAAIGILVGGRQLVELRDISVDSRLGIRIIGGSNNLIDGVTTTSAVRGVVGIQRGTLKRCVNENGGVAYL